MKIVLELIKLQNSENFSFRILLLLFIVALINFSKYVLTYEVSCESIIKYSFLPKTLACVMDETTVISSPGGTIANPPNRRVFAIWFEFNENIHFLPESTADRFPNLNDILASCCSIEIVTKANFRNLTKLRKLFLSINKISRIDSGTFEDLKSLKVLDLSMRKQFILN